MYLDFNVGCAFIKAVVCRALMQTASRLSMLRHAQAKEATPVHTATAAEKGKRKSSAAVGHVRKKQQLVLCFSLQHFLA